MKMMGTVKQFFEAKGFGFIARDDGQADLFFHITSVAREFVETIDVGSRVTFEVGTDKRQQKPMASDRGVDRRGVTRHVRTRDAVRSTRRGLCGTSPQRSRSAARDPTG